MTITRSLAFILAAMAFTNGAQGSTQDVRKRILRCRDALAVRVGMSGSEVYEIAAEVSRLAGEIARTRKELSEAIDLAQAMASGAVPAPKLTWRERLPFFGSPIPGGPSPTVIEARLHSLLYHFESEVRKLRDAVSDLTLQDPEARRTFSDLTPQMLATQGLRFRITLPGDHVDPHPLRLLARFTPATFRSRPLSVEREGPFVKAYNFVIRVRGPEEAQEAARRLQLWLTGIQQPIDLTRTGVEVAFPWKGTLMRTIGRGGDAYNLSLSFIDHKADADDAFRKIMQLVLYGGLYPVE